MEQHGNSGSFLFKFRVYQPTVQRWLSVDPIAEPGFEVSSLAGYLTSREGLLRYPAVARGGVNLYRFVRNSPVDKIDPYGLTIWYCTVPTDPFPSLGIGTHAYLWDDRPGTPDGERECGQESSSCSGPTSSGNGGPGGPDGKPGTVGTVCVPVDGTAGHEDDIMKDCQKHANTGIWTPGINDCHNKAKRCLKRNGIAPPPVGRFGGGGKGHLVSD